jgi:hypothetical protein
MRTKRFSSQNGSIFEMNSGDGGRFDGIISTLRSHGSTLLRTNGAAFLPTTSSRRSRLPRRDLARDQIANHFVVFILSLLERGGDFSIAIAIAITMSTKIKRYARKRKKIRWLAIVLTYVTIYPEEGLDS